MLEAWLSVQVMTSVCFASDCLLVQMTDYYCIKVITQYNDNITNLVKIVKKKPESISITFCDRHPGCFTAYTEKNNDYDIN